MREIKGDRDSSQELEHRRRELANRDRVWREERERVNQLADRLGKRIDPGIAEAVAALRVHRFSTQASCEGHARRGEPHPWVDISVPAPKGWNQAERTFKEWHDKPRAWRDEHPELLDRFREKQNEWRTANLHEQRRILELLSEFYAQRKTAYDVQLSLHPKGANGGMRLQSIGGEVMDVMDAVEAEEKAGLYREEMDAFAEFLRERYLF
jgi:hypothetical protein